MKVLMLRAFLLTTWCLRYFVSLTDRSSLVCFSCYSPLANVLATKTHVALHTVIV